MKSFLLDLKGLIDEIYHLLLFFHAHIFFNISSCFDFLGKI